MDRSESRHIVHVIPVLQPGGAENQLVELALAQREHGDRVDVLTLRADERLAHVLTEAGCTVTAIRGGGIGALRGAWRQRRADVVHAWMYHGFLLASLLRPFGSAKHVWSVRRTDPTSAGLSRPTRAVIAVCRRLAPRAPHALLYCSHAALAAHRDAGFRHRVERVVHNAVPERFVDGDGRTEPPDDGAGPAVGCLTRWSHDKGVDVLLRAWERYVELGGRGTLVLGGPGMDESNAELRTTLHSLVPGAPDESIESIGSAEWVEQVELAGATDDPAAFYRRLDVYVSPSRTEGFPNVVAEAMAARLAVVATDVGGTREVVGETGVLVPSDDPDAIANELIRLDRDPAARVSLGDRAFERCRREFGIGKTRSATDDVYRAAGA